MPQPPEGLDQDVRRDSKGVTGGLALLALLLFGGLLLSCLVPVPAGGDHRDFQTRENLTTAVCLCGFIVFVLTAIVLARRFGAKRSATFAEAGCFILTLLGAAFIVFFVTCSAAVRIQLKGPMH
jgi:hypothetical protein